MSNSRHQQRSILVGSIILAFGILLASLVYKGSPASTWIVVTFISTAVAFVVLNSRRLNCLR